MTSLPIPPPDSSTTPDNVLPFQRVQIPRSTSATTFPNPPAIAEFPVTSTSPAPRSDEFLVESIQGEIQRLSRLAQDEVFEDGVHNELSRAIQPLLQQYGQLTVDALSDLYITRLIGPAMISEVLPWLGRTEVRDSLDRNSRFWFLVYSLRDSNASVRGEAALGLASLDDKRAIPYLQQAAASESIQLLRRRLRKAADELLS